MKLVLLGLRRRIIDLASELESREQTFKFSLLCSKHRNCSQKEIGKSLSKARRLIVCCECANSVRTDRFSARSHTTHTKSHIKSNQRRTKLASEKATQLYMLTKRAYHDDKMAPNVGQKRKQSQLFELCMCVCDRCALAAAQKTTINN